MTANALQTLFARLAAGTPTGASKEAPHRQRLLASGDHGFPRVVHDIIAVRQLLASDTGTFHSMPEDLWR